MKPLTKTDLAYLQIRQKILEGALAPGLSLDQEDLAEELGLSTTPVREALRRLESERLVISRAHRDTVVAPLSHELVQNVYTIRLALDPLALSLAASRATSDERDEILALSRQVPDDSSPVSHLFFNRQLHRSMYAACGNELLIEILDSLWDLSDRYRLITLEEDNSTIKVAQEEHLTIVDAFVKGDSEQAAEIMRQHVVESFDRIRSSALIDE